MAKARPSDLEEYLKNPEFCAYFGDRLHEKANMRYASVTNKIAYRLFSEGPKESDPAKRSLEGAGLADNFQIKLQNWIISGKRPKFTPLERKFIIEAHVPRGKLRGDIEAFAGRGIGRRAINKMGALGITAAVTGPAAILAHLARGSLKDPKHEPEYKEYLAAENAHSAAEFRQRLAKGTARPLEERDIKKELEATAKALEEARKELEDAGVPAFEEAKQGYDRRDVFWFGTMLLSAGTCAISTMMSVGDFLISKYNNGASHMLGDTPEAHYSRIMNNVRRQIGGMEKITDSLLADFAEEQKKGRDGAGNSAGPQPGIQ